VANKKDKGNPERKMRLVKLVTGNTVLAGVLNKTETIELTQPMEVIVMPDRSGKTMITLMDFIPASITERVSIRRDHVICTAEADPKVIQLYEQATQPPSPVAQPAKPGLILPPGA